MILSDSSIVREMQSGNIIISPFEPKHLNPNSVDLTLAPQFKRYVADILDPRQPNPVAKVEGKSSLGRLGLFIHVTAGFIDTGFEGSLVLELVATRQIRLYPNMKICQIEFARVEGEILETYDKKTGSKYHGQTGVQESKYHENFR